MLKVGKVLASLNFEFSKTCLPVPQQLFTFSPRVRNCFGNSFFFFSGFFFFLVGGGFGAVQAPFWEKPGVKGRFVRVFQDIWGWF